MPEKHRLFGWYDDDCEVNDEVVSSGDEDIDMFNDAFDFFQNMI